MHKSYGNTRHNCHIRSDPCVFADTDAPAFENVPIAEVVVISDDCDMWADLHIVLQRDAADGHSGKAVVDEHPLPDSELFRKVDLDWCYNGKPTVVVAIKQLVKPLGYIVVRRLSVIEVMKREIGTLQFFDSIAVFL